MITLKKGQLLNLRQFNYIPHRKVISRIVLPITRWLRALAAEQYLEPGEKLLDLGSGDGYFMQRCQGKFEEIVGIDTIYGDHIDRTLPFEDKTFDCVTMLAVIEHLDHPWEIIKEIRRILKPGGQLIFTTPKAEAEKLINLYVKEIEHEHKQYFTPQLISSEVKGFTFEYYKTFIFGLNQVFSLRKKHE